MLVLGSEAANEYVPCHRGPKKNKKPPSTGEKLEKNGEDTRVGVAVYEAVLAKRGGSIFKI